MTNSGLFYRASPSNPYYFDGTRNGTISQYFGPNTKNVSKESFLGMIQGLQNLPKKKAIESNEGLPSNVGDRQNKSEAQTLDDSIKKLCQKGSLPKVYSTANNKDLLCMAREAFCKLPPDIRRTLEDKGKLGEFLDNVCYDENKKTLHDCYKDLIVDAKSSSEQNSVKHTEQTQATTQINTVNSDTPKINGHELGEQILSLQTEYRLESDNPTQTEIDVLEAKLFRESGDSVKNKEVKSTKLQNLLENYSDAFRKIGDDIGLKRTIMFNILATPQSVLKKICGGGKINDFVQNTKNAIEANADARKEENASVSRMETWAPLLTDKRNELQEQFASCIQTGWNHTNDEQQVFDRNQFSIAGKITSEEFDDDADSTFSEAGRSKLNSLLSDDKNSVLFSSGFLSNQERDMIASNIANLPGAIRDMVCKDSTTLDSFIRNTVNLYRENEENNAKAADNKEVGSLHNFEIWRFAIDLGSANSTESLEKANSTKKLGDSIETNNTNTTDNITVR